jgi:flavodoxin
MPSLTAIIATTSGHTEFVLDTVLRYWKERMPNLTVRTVRAELATADDLLRCDVLLLGSGTWNTGGVEGQLNPHMHELLFERVEGIDLQKKPVLLLSLGDDRYYFTTRCTERFMQFIKKANGTSLATPLIILNEPYDKVEKMQKWAEAVMRKFEMK